MNWAARCLTDAVLLDELRTADKRWLAVVRAELRARGMRIGDGVWVTA